LEEVVVLDLEDVVVLERVERQQALLERLHARLVRLLLAEERVSRRVLDDADAREARFLQDKAGSNSRRHMSLTFCALRFSAR